MRKPTLEKNCLVKELTVSDAPNGDGQVITLSVCRQDELAIEVVAYENNPKWCYALMKKFIDRGELSKGTVIDVNGCIRKNEKSGDDYMLCEYLLVKNKITALTQQSRNFGRNTALNIRGRLSRGEKLSSTDEKWCKELAQIYIVLSDTNKGIQLAKQGVTTTLVRISRCPLLFISPCISQYEAYLIEQEVLGCLRNRDGTSMFGVASDLGLTLTGIEGGESETFYSCHVNIVSLAIIDCLRKRFGAQWSESV